MGRWRVLLVAACVLAAGCSTAAGVWSSSDAEPTRTLTPAPVPETPATSRAPVPGVAPDGSVDSGRLAAAHADAVGNRTYTWAFRIVRTDPERGERVVDATRRVRVGPDATLVEDEGFPGYPPDQTVYLTDGAGYRQFVGIGTAHVLNTSRVDRNYVFAASVLQFNLREGRYRLRTVERSGRRYLRLHYPPAGATPGNATDAYTATAIVTRAGFVRELSVEYTDLRGHQVSLRYRYTDVGETTAPAPAWVSELRAGPDGTAVPSTTPRPTATPPPANQSQ